MNRKKLGNDSWAKWTLVHGGIFKEMDLGRKTQQVERTGGPVCGGIGEMAMRLGSVGNTGHTKVAEDSVAQIRLSQNTGLTRCDGGSGLGTETGAIKVENNGS